MSYEEFLLQDLKDNKSTSSWDWQADYRFAWKFFPDVVEDFQMLFRRNTLHSAKIAFHKTYLLHVKKARLRSLRKLQQKKLVVSGWMGLGIGGYSETGITKVRTYQLAATENNNINLARSL